MEIDMRQVLIGVSLVAAFASVPLVGQTRYLADAPGRWKPWMFNAYGDVRRVHGAKPAEVKDVEAQLLRLQAIIKKTDGFTNPVGFSIGTSGTLGLVSGRLSEIPGEPALTARPLPVQFRFGAFGISEYSSGGALKRDDGGETPGVGFYVNDLSQPLFAANDHAVPEFEKLDVDVVRLAKPQPDVFGLPRYGDTLVLKKSAAPFWVAVTLAETLELVTRGIDERLTRERDTVSRVQTGYDDIMDPRKREQRIAEYKKLAPLVKDPAYVDKMTKMEDTKQQMAGKELLPQIATLKAIVAKTEQELAATKTMAAGLSAADKTAAACYASGGQSVSRFRRAPAAGCDPLVRANWALFNAALPRSAPQLLTITDFAACLVPNRIEQHVGGCVANKRLLQSIDKSALLAWLQ
jgi:hypothetical protein